MPFRPSSPGRRSTGSRGRREDTGSQAREFPDRKAPVLYFEGKIKGLILNKTNASAIAVLYSEETNTWTGKEITIYPTMVEFQGRMVHSIRVKGPKLRNVTKTAG